MDCEHQIIFFLWEHQLKLNNTKKKNIFYKSKTWNNNVVETREVDHNREDTTHEIQHYQPRFTLTTLSQTGKKNLDHSCLPKQGSI